MLSKRAISNNSNNRNEMFKNSVKNVLYIVSHNIQIYQAYLFCTWLFYCNCLSDEDLMMLLATGLNLTLMRNASTVYIWTE